MGLGVTLLCSACTINNPLPPPQLLFTSLLFRSVLFICSLLLYSILFYNTCYSYTRHDQINGNAMLIASRRLSRHLQASVSFVLRSILCFILVNRIDGLPLS
jgi:hypothetical protein